MLQWLYTYVSSVSSKCSAISNGCCTCFIWVLHIFHTYVAIFHLDVLYVFTHMLQVFLLDVAYVLQWLHACFSRVSNICCKCFNCFRHMLQMFPLDVAKVDLVLHILQWTSFAAAACCNCWACLHSHGCGGGTSGRCGKSCRRRSRWKQVWDMKWAQNTERRGTPHEAGVRHVCPDPRTYLNIVDGS
jgi:hypothetical protein